MNRFFNHPLFVIVSIPVIVYGWVTIRSYNARDLFITDLIIDGNDTCDLVIASITFALVFLITNALWSIGTYLARNYHHEHRPWKNLAIAGVLGVTTYLLIPDLGLATNLALLVVVIFAWRCRVDLEMLARSNGDWENYLLKIGG